MRARNLLAGGFASVLLALCSPGSAVAATPPAFDRASALERSQAALGRTLGEYVLTDTEGREFALGALRGRPLVVSLVYTSCEHTCSVLTRHLARVVEVAREALGRDSFRVLTVGFDTRNDTPARMRLYARTRGLHEAPGWRFASAGAATMQALARELGFAYRPAPHGFVHLAQTTVLDAEGRVYRQVYGGSFEPPALVEPLKELVFGRRAAAGTLGGWVDRVRLFCTLYDPASGRYRFDYSIFIGAGIGILSLGAVAVFVIRAWRRSGPPGIGVRGQR